MHRRFVAWFLVLVSLLVLLVACSSGKTATSKLAPNEDELLSVDEAVAKPSYADETTIAAQGSATEIYDENALHETAYKFFRNSDELKWEDLKAGTYNIYAWARGELYGSEAPAMTITIGSQTLTKSFENTSYQQTFFGRVTVNEGDSVTATFINDAWGGTPATDRNLILSHIWCEPITDGSIPTTPSEPAPGEPTPPEPTPSEPSTPPTPSEPPPSTGGRPYVIYLDGYSGDGARTPSILENLSYLESLPFDGIVLDIPATWNVMKPGVSLDYTSEYTNFIAPLQGKLGKFSFNMVRAVINDPGDLFDDAAWNQATENWRILARLAKDVGAKGIFFDNEEYFDKWLNYPEDYASPTRSKEDYIAQARLRGKQVMEAVMQEFPDINLATLHGPYLSESATPSYVKRQQVGDASDYELSGPFTIGMMEAQNGNARITDGGEVYQYRTVDDFKNSYTWRDQTIASESVNSSFIPSSLKSVWSSKLDISFGLYTGSWPNPQADVMNPSIMRTTLANALRVADKFVWIYSDTSEALDQSGLGWLKTGGMPGPWQDAIRSAKEDATN
jgi:hypothetical protein